jgi:hypothetical protein
MPSRWGALIAVVILGCSQEEHEERRALALENAQCAVLVGVMARSKFQDAKDHHSVFYSSHMVAGSVLIGEEQFLREVSIARERLNRTVATTPVDARTAFITGELEKCGAVSGRSVRAVEQLRKQPK